MDPTNLFTILGRYVKSVNEIDGWQATLDTRESNIASVHNSSGSLLTINNLNSTYNAARSNLQSAVSRVITQAQSVLTDYDLVVSNLPIKKGANFRTVLEALYDDMVQNSYYVSPTNPSATGSDPAPTDNGEVQGFLTMDGSSNPLSGVSSFKSWASQETQLIYDSENLIVTCVADSYTDGLSVDSERFTVVSENTDRPYRGFLEGSGLNTNMQALGASNLLSSTTAGFTSFTSGTPAGWTVDSGTAGTTFDQTTTSSDVFRNSSALQVNSGQAAQFTLTTTLSSSNFTPQRAYILGCYAKTSSSTESFTVKLKDGTTTLGTVTVDSSAGTVDYERTFNALIVLPETITATNLTIELDGSPAASTYDADINIGMVYLTPAQYHAGLPILIAPHSTPFIRGDRLQLALANGLESSNGRFQQFFRRAFGFQLPYSGSNLLADTLITS